MKAKVNLAAEILEIRAARPAELEVETPISPEALEAEEKLKQQLITRRIALKRAEKKVSELLKSLDSELKPLLEPGEIILSDVTGTGYENSQTETLIYNPLVIWKLIRRGLIHRFVKISTQGLKDLKKEKLLSAQDLKEMQALAVPEIKYMLREYVPAEAKVV